MKLLEKLFLTKKERNLIGQDSMAGLKVKNKYKLMLMSMFFVCVIGALGLSTGDLKSSAFAIAPVAVIAGGNIKKESEMSQDEKDTLATIQKAFNDAITEFARNQEAPENLEKSLNEIIEKHKDSQNSSGFVKQLKELEGISKSMVALANKVDELEKKGDIDLTKKDGELQMAIKSVLESDKFKDFAEGRSSKSTGKIPLITKAIASLTSNYTGSINISMQSPYIGEHPQPRKINMRDIIQTDTGDSNYPSITYQQIYELDRNVTAVSENGALSESSFKVKEITDAARRIGTSLPISKRMLKAVPYLVSYLSNRLPLWVRMAEDFQILKGDGNGNNIKGIVKYCPNFKDVLGTVLTGVATSVDSVESYDGGAKTKVNFKDAQPLLNNGMKITFSSFNNSAYNASFVLEKMNDRSIVINVAYTSQTGAQCAAATWVAGGEFAASVEAADAGNVLKAAIAYLTYGEYMPNGIAINPVTVFEIDNIKDTMGRKIDYFTMVNGVRYIGGVAVVETTAVVPGEFVVGDFMLGAALVDFTSVEFEFAEDVTTKKQNEVVAIVQEEVIMPVYNPYAFLQGKISECITLLDKPVES